MEKPEKYVLILQKSVIGSIIKDIFTFGMFAGLMWFNHALLSGSTFIDFLFILIVIMLLATRNSKKLFNGKVKDAIEFLEKL